MELDPAPTPSPYRDHVVICGLHDEGLRIVEHLVRSHVDTVVVGDSPDRRLLGPLARLGVPHLELDARVPESLEAANIAAARALVVVESDDVATLAIALGARESWPELRIVAELANAAVGRALSGAGIMVVDVAKLAAPSIVQAALRRRVRPLSLLAGDYSVMTVDVERAASLRELYGDLTPLAVLRPPPGARTEDDEVLIAPPRDTGVGVGEQAVLIGPSDDEQVVAITSALTRTNVAAVPAYVGARAMRTQPRTKTLARHFLGVVDRRVWLALGVLIAMSVTSVTLLTIGYRTPDGHRMSILDAAYFTVETISTVGFGDFSFSSQHAWLRVWAIMLMLFGVSTAAVMFALLTNMVISATLSEALGRRRLTGLDAHLVVVGAGSLGTAVVSAVRAEGIEVVVVERDQENRFLPRLREEHVPLVFGDATQSSTWDSARLERARAVAVLTSRDLTNIETGLAVRDLLADRWAEVPAVLRVFDRQLAGTVRRSFDFRSVISPAEVAAPWFVGAALGLEVIRTFYAGPCLLMVARLTVAEGGALVGRAMIDLGARIRVVALVRADGGIERIPRRDTRFAAGDVAELIGPQEELLVLLREAESQRPTMGA